MRHLSSIQIALAVLCWSGVVVAQPSEPPPPDAQPEPPAVTPPVVEPAPAPPPAPAPAPVVVVTSAPSPALVPAPAPLPDASTVTIGGYLQPQFRLRQDSPAQFDQDGFRFARARLILGGKTRAGNLDLSATVEAEMQPTFTLADAYATASRELPHHGRLTIDVGQMRVPVSRQNLISDSRLSFVDKAQLATIAPDRDLGARLSFRAPHVPWIRVLGGVFNGEGKNQVENINQHYLDAVRIEISPVGYDVPLQESNLAGPYVTAAASLARNKLNQGRNRELVTYLGADLAFGWHGLSGAVEYLEVRHGYDGPDPSMIPPSYKANGWAAQLAYLLPVGLPPVRDARLELAARFEEIDRNDTVSITQPGDPNQSVREITGVVSYYLRKHAIKAQVAVSKFIELEDRTVTGADATYNNDQVLVQVTYRVE